MDFRQKNFKTKKDLFAANANVIIEYKSRPKNVTTLAPSHSTHKPDDCPFCKAGLPYKESR
jgi:hypothetical protein